MGENQTVEVEVPAEVQEEPAQEVPATEQDYAEAGFAPEEIDMAKEQGMIKEPEDENKDDVKPEEKPAEKAEVKDGEELKDEKDDLKHPDGTPYNRNEQGLYWDMKKDRRKRQEAEEIAKRLQLENKYLSENLNNIKTEQEKVAQELADLRDKSESEYLTDAEKAERVALRDKERELKAKEVELTQTKTDDQRKEEVAQRATERLHESEQDFRMTHKDIDFDHCATLAGEVLAAAKGNDIDRLLGDEVKSAYAEKMAIKFIENSTKLANGEPMDEELPELVYKMAKIHPKYNGVKEPELKGKDVRNGKIVPEKNKDIDRMMRNADRRNTAALSGSGGGRVKMSEEDLTYDDFVRLPQSEVNRLSTQTVNRLLRDSCKT